MQDIHDCKGHLVCKGEPTSGLVEAIYKRQLTMTHLGIGGEFIVEREGIRTIVTRKSWYEFKIDSFELPA